jgi:hypothetical protein
MNSRIYYFLVFVLFSKLSFAQQPSHNDVPFIQDYSVKYYFEPTDKPLKTYSDRNKNIKVLTSAGLKMPFNGKFLYPGTFVKDNTYRTSGKKTIKGLTTLERQFVLTEENHVFSHAWAGKVFIKTPFNNPTILAGGKDFDFLVSDGKQMALVNSEKTLYNENSPNDPILDIRYNKTADKYFIRKKSGVYESTVKNPKNRILVKGNNFTSFDISKDGQILFIGTTNGYIEQDLVGGTSHTITKLPSTDITSVKVINDKIWFGSPAGAFAIHSNQKIDYYNGERWLPSNKVIHIEEGPDNSVLILTDKGLGHIHFKKMTLAEKANFYDQQVRSRHIRNGFNATLSGLKNGNLNDGFLSDSDNDGLWTSMYLGGEAFRYAVTQSPEALQNVRESLDAMERLFTVNPVEGFAARSFERSGYIKSLSDPERWQHSADKEWDWKSTTSSDEAIGHIFVYAVIAELVDIPEIKNKAVTLIDTMMSHILKNNMYLVDFDGKPTQWGKWNPEYVNGFPTNVGDRKLNSSNITAMLQTAYHFTKKEKYKEKALDLLNNHGYYENLMRPMQHIGSTPDGGDDYAKMLSESWNHSDDEMYFLGYWGLYRYALNDTLKQAYRKTILDHFESERPEKDGLWNIITALTGTKDFDLDEAVWYLQEHPLDLIQWNIENSHRKDIETIKANFRTQTTKEVLPPDERPAQRHNANMFRMDRTSGNGVSELSAGDIWLLPYWMGRYLGVIR